ncbi:E3 ubiquitin-protein ligase APD2-like isoform X2 [Hyalella azteca]|uniref:E3 ubiquitin-protein ligase APD2-like isoform X2 n=1 Tax=Hyalella azteca TaxID=294128 RepID=A0A979FIH3_HYAAZ|nr:E3 ubiquitin-protein ligase APD2-like isoform X2 [Hyalella azteca]
MAGTSGSSSRVDRPHSSPPIQADGDDSDESLEDFVTRRVQFNIQEQHEGASGRSDERLGTICLICRVAAVNCLNQPCGHIVACFACMVENQRFRSTCPYCTSEVANILQVMVRGAE